MLLQKVSDCKYTLYAHYYLRQYWYFILFIAVSLKQIELLLIINQFMPKNTEQKVHERSIDIKILTIELVNYSQFLLNKCC